ncbi:MAG TPA: sigma 54-interacting transcriptional regulator [Candidatus Deferrimicrobiaceae bacterium]
MSTDRAGRPSPEDAGLRRDAEARIRKVAAGGAPPVPAGPDLQRLVHELEVHRIELEMQNAELRRAREELEASRDRYAELYDFAPIGYFTFDAAGTILESNLAGARMLGMERRLLEGRPFPPFIAGIEGRAAFSEHIERILRDGGVRRCEITLSGKEGASVHARFQSVAVGADDGRELRILSSITDVTTDRLLGEELRKVHDNLESTVTDRTRELNSGNLQLTQEIAERRKAEASLQNAYSEIKRLKDRLLAENIYLQKEVAQEHNYDEIVGQSEALSHIFLRINQVAPMDATVLLLGETGTGKGLVARAIHGHSARKKRSMITVNCSALPANLIESELFGREKGAFTGASARQIGRFELADGGTIFLDEIGEMPLDLQTKLLRVIQDGEFERLGGPRTIKVDVRIIAASNRSLEEEIRNGRFREDLYYRLNVFPIKIPPLRMRREDIPPLVEHFLAKFNKKVGKRIETVPKITLDTLLAYHWPGNVRELESVIERAVITSQGRALEVLDRFDTFRNPEEAAGQDEKPLAEMARDHILQVLRKTGWKIEGKSGAAAILKVNPSTLRARMRKYGIHRQSTPDR